MLQNYGNYLQNFGDTPVSEVCKNSFDLLLSFYIKQQFNFSTEIFNFNA
jgi:hypothetical protein